MSFKKGFLIVVAGFSGAVLLCSPCAANGGARSMGDPVELALLRAMPIDGPPHFEPSGLALREGELWTVSDKHDAAVYRIHIDETRATATAEEVLPNAIEALPKAERRFDAEGIAIAPDGTVYLASETHVRLFAWRDKEKHWAAASDDFSAVGRAVGLFALKNAWVEGIAALDDGTLLLAAERQPRGLIEVHGLPVAQRVCAQEMDASKFPLLPGRTPDFADLAVWRGRVFALARNQHLVVELVRAADGSWCEGNAWSYASTENDPAYRYRDRTFGLGEGLAIDDQRILVVLDNNEDTRETVPQDSRPLLFVFRNSIDR